MRPRFQPIFFAATISAVAFAFSWLINWSDLPHGRLGLASAAAADNSGAPAPGDLSNPALTPPPPGPADNSGAPAGAEVLSKGPVHEAFAKPMELNPQPGPIAKKRPPDPIKEIPPEQQPEGDNIVWIPGYWSWADDRNDFIWVSGVLRAAPPGQTWVPGYWSEVDGGFQWTPGLWTAIEKQEVSYQPEPPQSLETGPSSPQPSDNQFWIPGTWFYQNTGYAWRPGYWTVGRPGWIWVPAHFVWTPGGYVFVDGYWDYELTRRGVLFAPVYFAQPVYAQPAFVYTPGVVFNIGLFSDCLFVRPAFGAYYFGNYFGPQYANIGISPWFTLTIGSRPHFDPLFTYYNWHNSLTDHNWMAHTEEHFDVLRRDEALHPHTFAAGNALVMPLKDVAKDPTKTDFRFHNVSLADRQALALRGNELQQVAQQRVDIERKTNAQFLGGAGTGRLAHNGITATNPGAGNAAGLTKLKLPTAAASNMKLSSNVQQNNSVQTNNAAGQKFENNTRAQNNLNESNSQTTTRFNRPSMIQPGSGGLQSGGAVGNAFSGNGLNNQNPSNGASTNPSSNRMFTNPNPSGGNPSGGATRGTGGSNKDKDKDDKKNKTSDDTVPRPHMNYELTKPAVFDVPAVLKEQRKTMGLSTATDDAANHQAGSSALDLKNRDSLTSTGDDSDHDNADNSKDDSANKSKAFSYQPPALFRTPSDANNDFNGLFKIGDNRSSAAAPDSDQSNGTNSGTAENDAAGSGAAGSGAAGSGAAGGDRPLTQNGLNLRGPSGPSATAPQNGAAAARTSPASSPIRNPALSRYDYQTLLDRGHSLSMRTSYAATPMGAPSNDSDIPGPLPHGVKDPISSIGPGSSGEQTMYGTPGLTTGMNSEYSSGMPSGPLSSGSGVDNGMSRGTGSYISPSSLPTLPHYDLHMAKPTGPAPILDGTDRSYDPNRGY